jgi:hypothetical protein
LILCGGDPESIRIFRLQKQVIRKTGNVGQYASCRNLFKELNILPVTCLYTSEVVCYVKSNMENMKCNEEAHDHCTRQKKNIYIMCSSAESLFLKIVQMWA